MYNCIWAKQIVALKLVDELQLDVMFCFLIDKIDSHEKLFYKHFCLFMEHVFEVDML